MICENSIIIRQPPQYIEHMAALLEVRPNARQRIPCMPELRDKDVSEFLSPVDASKFRAAVGTGLYISADRPDIGYTIRLLASSMASPTKQALRGLVKLIQYLLNTAGYATCLCIGPPGCSKLHGSMDADSASAVWRGISVSDCSSSEHLLECFSDADWSGSKKDRRSYGGASFCLDGCYLHYICRAQKCVSLSSMEAEYYGAVGAACQGLFMQVAIAHMSEEPCKLVVLLDNSSARQFCLRQGVSKAAKHIEGRLLWLQDAVRLGRLQLKPVSTHYNMGDLFTKPFSPARLLALCYMHGFVNAHDESVGEKEWEDIQLKHNFKQQVRRVKHQFANTSMTSSWVKKIALLTLLMPDSVEACRSTCCGAMHFAMLPIVVTAICALFLWRALSTDGADNDSFVAILMVGAMLLQEYATMITAELYCAVFLRL